jgi:hypothetical protein
MLTVLFVLSLMVIAASVVRRPQLFWQRAVLVVAAMTLIAVSVAWTIEFVLRSY